MAAAVRAQRSPGGVGGPRLRPRNSARGAGQVVQLGEEERRALTFGNLVERPLKVTRQAQLHGHVFRRRRRAMRLAGPRQETDDLAAAELVERDTVGDLVEPRAGVLRL